MPIFDEMEKQKVFKFIMSRHEQGAAFMVEFFCDPSEIVLPMVPAGGAQ
jgi:hypothetical protein